MLVILILAICGQVPFCQYSRCVYSLDNPYSLFPSVAEAAS